jgi:hypothetical protein
LVSRVILYLPTQILFYFSDARGDVLRGLQVVETAVGITSNLLGDHVEGISHTSIMYTLID